MNEKNNPKIWVAVRVERGFVEEVRAYRDEATALRQERSWRRGMNPDYDETGVCSAAVHAIRSRGRRPSVAG